MGAIIMTSIEYVGKVDPHGNRTRLSRIGVVCFNHSTKASAKLWCYVNVPKLTYLIWPVPISKLDSLQFDCFLYYLFVVVVLRPTIRLFTVSFKVRHVMGALIMT